ncbi:hypothetical protein EMWEY_00025430 [Eimeria maxima]|uniref:Uncharacterized protein n=1 Tax=Eimeria maxima TaxID=5804 RepID=U6LY08_EIMMA|nr:hypothetical protein EMWEY_00025430 [Eimeria maxima]CDJ56852.1 hypothetical protein EMWEY_00025430 [Eimeria maxima]
MYGETVATACPKAPLSAQKCRAHMALAGAFLIHLTLGLERALFELLLLGGASGSLHAFGNIAPLIIAYMRQLQPTASLRYHDGLILYVSAVLVQGIAGFFGGRLHRALGPSKATLLGGSVMSIGLVMSALTLHSCFLFCLSFGVVTAIGSGLCYPVPLTCALEWQPDRKGTVSCVIFLGRSLSVCLLCPMHSLFLFRTAQHSLLASVAPVGGGEGTLAAPEVYVSDTEVLQRLPALFLLMAGGCLVLQSVLVAAYMWKIVPFAFMHKVPPNTYLDTAERSLLPAASFADGVRSWQAITDLQLSTIGAVAGALCVAGRLVWGYIGNKAGNKRAIVIMNLCMAALLMTFMNSSMASPRNFAVWLALLNACHGGLFSLLPSLTSDLFGHKNFGPVFSLLFAARLCAAACICALTKVVLELADGVTLCMTLAGCHVLCAGLALAFHPTEALPTPYKLVMP